MDVVFGNGRGDGVAGGVMYCDTRSCFFGRWCVVV
jgi:hypothetical protein